MKRIITTKELISRIPERIMDTRGIMHTYDWPNATPVTLRHVLEDFEKAESGDGVFWIVEEEDGPAREEKPGILSNYSFEQCVKDAEEAAIAEENILDTTGFDKEQRPEEEPVYVGMDLADGPDMTVIPVSINSEPAAVDVKELDPAAVAAGPLKHKMWADLGKWEEYKGRALSTREQNEIIKGMSDEGYTQAVISLVVRLSLPTIRARLKRMGNGEE